MAPPRKKLVPPHKKVNDFLFGRTPRAPTCPLCRGRHTINQHRFHGVGSSTKVFRNDQ